MGKASSLPFHYVDYLRSPGIPFSGGTVALRSYMCKTISNGGNDSATSLYKNLRWMREGRTGPRLNEIVGGTLVDEALKGQGVPWTFKEIWNFMCRNKSQLDTYKVEVCARREKSDGYAKHVIKTGTVHDLYFDGRSDQAAIQAMADDGFFGIDCVGFVGGYLFYAGEWSGYQGATPAQWPLWHCTENVKRAKDIRACDFVLWNGHIAMIDWVWKLHDDKTVEVDIAQCSDGGPQYNERVILKETSLETAEKWPRFKFHAKGTPTVPVQGYPFIMRRTGFHW